MDKDIDIHLGIGHYGIGFKDGVNTVIARNVRALLKVDPSLKITLFGKLSPDYRGFLEPIEGRLEYRNIEEFNAEIFASQLGGKTVFEQEVHDYIWLGTKLAEILIEKLADMDVIMIENLGIGIQPYVTYAFSLYAQYIYNSRENKKLVYRFHDFVQQRPKYFSNIKKFHQYPFGFVPHWHSIIYPDYPNIKYITVNRYDQSRLFEHGVEEKNVYYVPNSVDASFVSLDDKSEDLRSKIIEREDLDQSVRFILYPVRCIRRKNVEEAIFLTKFFNCLSDKKATKKNMQISGKFHLIVGLRPKEGEDANYASQLIDFVNKNKLPVTIGLDDLVSFKRQNDTRAPDRIVKYSIGDLYKVAELCITTSILEGFGYSYIEPWLNDRPVIGRSIPFITHDFQTAGMKLGHLYTALIIEKQDYKDIGRNTSDPDEALQIRLSKILKLDDPEYLDNFIHSNETSIMGTLRLLNEKKTRGIVNRNKKIVKTVYSQDNIGRQLYKVITS
jgi:hypothetical protein